ncbi:MAG: GNAT family N-acetyltransferase [Solirubrobacteraceae bacterium]
MAAYELSLLTNKDAELICTWRYEPPYDTYDVPSDGAAAMLDPLQRFCALRRDGELIAYVCLGAEARVPGLAAVPDVDDLGFGLRPDLIGQGLSREILPWLLGAVAPQLEGGRLRVVILDWNLRSLGAYRRAGFLDTGSHTNGAGTFLLLERDRP